ncbi:hypothetical protein [Microbacterium sp. C7(2022)]|uniref:hypothetical protein n=1 Tax=Microbacterium sp. C7(2022) TaxID=2992759 RepID=UPI00237B6352|nr:hypothetical protein [Microbacterium sp. C7(2022)]MDE0545493.1 hypothetical protein [Microbacterium sp. C7(2022)]
MTPRDRLLSAALVLASGVNAADLIATNSTVPADRSPRADRLRGEALAADLATFRAALAEFNAEVAA